MIMQYLFVHFICNKELQNKLFKPITTCFHAPKEQILVNELIWINVHNVPTTKQLLCLKTFSRIKQFLVKYSSNY